MQHLNLDPKAVKDKRMAQLRELEELRYQAFENTKLYKERTKKWHDQRILNREFHVGDKVLLFNTRVKLFPGKLRSKWTGPFKITKVLPFGAVELKGQDKNFLVNAHRIKHYYGDTQELNHIDHLYLQDVL